MEKQTHAHGRQVEQALAALAGEHVADVKAYRGRGLGAGVPRAQPGRPRRPPRLRSADGQVVKLIPPLTVTSGELAQGLGTLSTAVADTR